MKKRSLKITSMLLALIMVFCALPFTTALAVSAEDALEGFKLGENFTITSDVVQDGQNAIKHSSAAESTMTIGTVNVEKNTTYLLTGWLRRADENGVAKLTVKGNGLEQSVESIDTGRWTYYSKEVETGDNTQILVSATGKGEVYFDAISFKGMAKPEASLIMNGDFEDGVSGWGSGVQSDITHNNSGGAWKNGGGFPVQTVEVEKNTWYVLSGYIYRADKNSWTYIDMQDIAGEVQLRATNDDKIGDWEYIAGLWNSGDRSDVNIRIVAENNWDDPYGPVGGGTAYVDDISLVRANVGKELLSDPNFDKRNWELSGNMSISNDVYFQEAPGLASGIVSKDTPSIAWANNGDLIELQTDTDYFISGWFFRTSLDGNKGGKTVKGEIQILDENNNILASYTGSRYNQKDWHYNPSVDVKNADWEYVYGLWNSGGYSKVKIRIIAEAQADTVTDKMYFEEVSFRQAALSTVSENLLSYNMNMFDEKSENELMDGNFDLQFKTNARFNGAVIDPEGKMGDEVSFELYTWVDSYKRTLQNTPLEKNTIKIEEGKKFLNLSFKREYEAGEYLLVVKYNGEIIKYASNLGVIYTDSINLEKAVPRMQIVFTDESDSCFGEVDAKSSGYEYVADYNAPTAAEKQANRAEYEGYIKDLSTFPTTMSIGGKQITGFPEDTFTKVSQDMVKEEDNHSEHTTTVLTYKEFEGLQFTIESYYYPDYAAFDWTIYYENTSDSENTPIIKDIQSVDMNMKGGDQYLLTNKGDAGRYAAEEYSLVGMRKIYKPTTGRSTQGAYPYYNFEYGDGGSLIAIGWNGQWQATFDCRTEGETNFKAGQELFNAYLKPGEKMRTPLVAFIRYDGRDTDRAINLWRRWLINCNLRKVTDGPDDKTGEKHLFAPQISGGTSVLYHEMTQATDENQIAAIKWYKDNDIDISFWWMDAGWYFKTSNEGVNEGKGQSLPDGAWGYTGVWQVDTKRFPSKMKAISDFGETVGVHTLLWFEPERIGDGGCCLTDGTTVKTEWLLGAVVNLGNPDAVEWFKQRITKILGEGGIYMYREDFNIAPLSYWRNADASDRQGITENKYIQGHMELWDFILDEYPYVTIDSCASGGNRNDLETYRRAVALHKTDLDYGNTTMQQGIEYAYNQWNVYYGSKANGDGDNGTYFASKYALRTATCPWMVLGYSTHKGIPNPNGVGYIAGEETPLDTYVIRDAVDQQWATSEYIYADYYPLTSLDQTEQNWIGWEYYDEAKGSGYALAFRRTMGVAQQKLRLKGLDPKANYTVYFEDRNDYGTYSGAQLMYEGILWTLPAERTSDILWINLASNNIEERDLTVNVTGPSVNTVASGWTTGEVKAAIYEVKDSYEFAIRLNMALRDTFLGNGKGRTEDVDVAEYGDLITVNDMTLSEIDEAAPGAVKLVYDVDLHILNVFIAKDNAAEFAPTNDNKVIVNGLVSEQGVEMADVAVFDYSAETKAWKAGDKSDVPVTSITITNTEKQIATGEALELTVEVIPEVRAEDVVWTVVSGDAVIDGNKLTANKAGDIVVKASVDDMEDTITFKAVTYCEDFDITNMNANPDKGDKGTYTVVFTPEDCSEKITFKSSDQKVFKVDENGNWVAVAEGEAKLLVTCGDVTKTYDITVKDNSDNPDKPIKPDDPDKPEKPEDPNKPVNPGDPDHPKTGDNSNMWIWIALFVTAAAGAAIVCIRRYALKAKK